METRKEPYRPVPIGNLKSQTVNLRTSPDENDILKAAAEKLSQQTGEKENISKTIIEAVKQFKDAEPFFFNEKLYNSYCAFYEELYPYFQRIAEGYILLGLGNISAEIMRKLTDNDFSEISTKVYSDIEQNLKKTGVTNKFLLDKLRTGLDEPYLKWKLRADLDLLQVGRLRNIHSDIPFDVNVYSFKDGIISFSDSSRQRIKTEKCTVYIDSDIKRDFLKLSEKTLEDLKALKAILNKNGINDLFGEGKLFNLENDQITITKSILGQIKK